MFALTNHSDNIGIRGLMDDELDHVAGGQCDCLNELKNDIADLFTALHVAIDSRLDGIKDVRKLLVG